MICTALYPVFFAQSSMAHLDMMAAAFTFWGLAMYVERASDGDASFFSRSRPWRKRRPLLAPLALLAWELLCPWLRRRTEAASRCVSSAQAGWRAFLAAVPVPLVLWLAYHHHRTGYYFGNPEYLRYNLGATLNPLRMLLAMLIRLWHLLGYLNLFVLTLARLCDVAGVRC